MGAMAQSQWLDGDIDRHWWVQRVLAPCVDALRERGTSYRGCLYAGLMLTGEGPRVLEFNARFGDPEAQVILPLLAEDTLDLLLGCAHGNLTPGIAAVHQGVTVGVVAASAGYPGSVSTGAEITGVERLDDGVLCFHAGTRREDHRLLTAGGRVLTVVAHAADPVAAQRAAYANLDRIAFDGMWSRRDIAESVPVR
jgi:phosphoribosylamine--glycine ligase